MTITPDPDGVKADPRPYISAAGRRLLRVYLAGLDGEGLQPAPAVLPRSRRAAVTPLIFAGSPLLTRGGDPTARAHAVAPNWKLDPPRAARPKRANRRRVVHLAQAVAALRAELNDMALSVARLEARKGVIA